MNAAASFHTVPAWPATGRAWGATAVLGAHLLLVLGLLSMDLVPRVVAQATPLMVSLLRSAEPAAPSAPALPAPRPRTSTVAAVAPALPIPPVLPTAPPLPTPAMAPPAAVTRRDAAPPTLSAAPAERPAPASTASTPPPPAPAVERRQVPASAVQYQVLPPVEVPRASRRAGEHGTVWLRVVVGLTGLPVQVSVQRSSGHARLDEQALWAMRQARFKPHTEDGRAVEVEVIAPIEYPDA